MHKLYKVDTFIEGVDFSGAKEPIDVYMTGIITGGMRNLILLHWDIIIDTFSVASDRGMYMTNLNSSGGIRFQENLLKPAIINAKPITYQDAKTLEKFSALNKIGYNLSDEIVDYLGQSIELVTLDPDKKKILVPIFDSINNAQNNYIKISSNIRKEIKSEQEATHA